MSACHKSWLFLAQMQHPPVSQVETKEWRCAELHGYMNTRINSTGPPYHQCQYHQLDQSKINDGHFSNENVSFFWLGSYCWGFINHVKVQFLFPWRKHRVYWISYSQPTGCRAFLRPQFCTDKAV